MTTRGGQRGNNNAGNAKYAKRALEKALKRRDGHDIPDGLDTFETVVDIWDVQIGNALAGDKGSAQMIVERLDGKPKQEVEQSNTHDVTDEFKEFLLSIDGEGLGLPDGD